MEINEVCDAAHKTATEKGFWEDYDRIMALIPLGELHDSAKKAFLSQKIMLTVSELGESMEALRKNRSAKVKDYSLDMFGIDDNQETFTVAFEKNIKDTFEDELADALIRIYDLAGKMDIDLDWHVKLKMRYNSTRPHKHGKKF